MRKSRLTEGHVVAVLHEGAAGANVKELCRRHGISEQTYYRWKAPFSGLQVNDTKRLTDLEEEIRRLKRIVAVQALNLAALTDVLGKAWWRRSSGGPSSRIHRRPPLQPEPRALTCTRS